MTTQELDRIKAARDRNRAAMEAEKLAAETRKREEAERQARMDREQPAMMVQMVDLVLSCPGRPLTSGQVARLKEIRLRNGIMAEVARLKGGF